MFLDPPPLGTAVEVVALVAAYRLPRPNLTKQERGHNRIRVKVDEVDSKFNMTKNHTTLKSTFGIYRMLVPSREE